jgi:hypothetical protein
MKRKTLRTVASLEKNGHAIGKTTSIEALLYRTFSVVILKDLFYSFGWRFWLGEARGEDRDYLTV